jgi:hypothetical protein
MKHLNRYKVFETLNSRGSKSLTESEVREIVNVNCKFWLNEDKSHKELGDTLFRSQRDMGPFVFTDARGTYRTSIEDVNLHVVLMDNLECWKDYPKYSEGIIGLSDEVPNYGDTLYEMVPFDNIKIGVCPSYTIWHSFSKHGHEFGQYIWATNHFLELCDIDANSWEQQNDKYEFDGSTIETRLKELGVDEINNCDGCEFLNIMYRELGEGDYNGEQCFNFIKDFLFNPVKRGFSLQTYDESFEVYYNRQIWCSGPVVLLEQESAPEDYTKEWFKE